MNEEEEESAATVSYSSPVCCMLSHLNPDFTYKHQTSDEPATEHPTMPSEQAKTGDDQQETLTAQLDRVTEKDRVMDKQDPLVAVPHV
ncbi:hypothetical protein DCS_02765 [Drechmeria coniospora]|uniref:Uncharacterized protein n=1 Tax=Drechmeria coniospora TaxID=98403 RepID=A0A151GX63_DRECN|nr:hypothetical protein DCS_02765 [Drechmeria coniospora]KYK61622.1 hypothetical protein DCS_02765 [Drechmeria coniospora]